MGHGQTMLSHAPVNAMHTLWNRQRSLQTAVSALEWNSRDPKLAHGCSSLAFAKVGHGMADHA